MRPDGAGTLAPQADGTGEGVGGNLVERILISRGLTDEDSRTAFLHPSFKSLSHPSTLPGAQEAAVRLVEAVRGRKSIAIYGDYDVDGIMATAILFHALTLALPPGVSPRLYVPHRVKEGYGLNEGALERLAEEGVELLITVDCGVTAIDLTKRARELGIELIITDHHSFAIDAAGRPQLPEPDVLVHPARPDAPAPFIDLCGGGVAYKVAWAFLERWYGSKPLSKDGQDLLQELLPFAALATIADVVPLVRENRIITSHGLKQLPEVKNTGLRALLSACDLDKPTAMDIAFRLAPVLNAAGRLGSAMDAVELVTTASGAKADKIAKQLVNRNKERQVLCRTITKQAEKMAEEQGLLESGNRAIVLAHKDWEPGVVGICCSRLAERFGRPVILLQRSEETCRGSARSIPGYSVHDALAYCAKSMNQSEEVLVFGGHAAAAGCTVATSAFGDLREKMLTHASGAIKADDLVGSIEVDGVVGLAELDLCAVRQFEQLGPFGAGNPPPRLVLHGVKVTSAMRMGKDGAHLRAHVSKGGLAFSAIWWRGAEKLENLEGLIKAERNDKPLDLLVEAQVNRWRGRESVQLMFLDVHTVEAAEGALPRKPDSQYELIPGLK